jgi:hypothetical protein
MRRIDREALELGMKLAREGPDARGEQLDRMLERGRTWEQVATFASMHCQCVNLRLKCDELPPAWGSYCVGRDDQAVALQKRMRRAGVSLFHPDPLAAIAAAEKRSSEPATF